MITIIKRLNYNIQIRVKLAKVIRNQRMNEHQALRLIRKVASYKGYI